MSLTPFSSFSWSAMILARLNWMEITNVSSKVALIREDFGAKLTNVSLFMMYIFNVSIIIGIDDFLALLTPHNDIDNEYESYAYKQTIVYFQFFQYVNFFEFNGGLLHLPYLSFLLKQDPGGQKQNFIWMHSIILIYWDLFLIALALLCLLSLWPVSGRWSHCLKSWCLK